MLCLILSFGSNGKRNKIRKTKQILHHNILTSLLNMCRQSMDMFTSVNPPSISFLRGASLTGGVSSFLSTAYKRPKPSECDSSLSRPLIPEVLSSTSPEKLSASTYSKVSFSVLPPPQEQCSFSQAVINGKKKKSLFITLLFNFIMYKAN